MPLNFNFSLIKDFCDCQTIAYHHDNIYKKSVEKLNFLLSNKHEFHTWCLEELIFNSNKLPETIREDVLYYASKVYNHQIFFNSISNKCCENINDLIILKKICDTYGDFESFKKTFIDTAMSMKVSGYVWLVCDDKGEVFISTSNNEDTLISKNLYQLMGIDLWEHSYFCCMNKINYICSFFKYLNWTYINKEYLEAKQNISL